MSYSKTFNEKHQLYVGADYSISEQHLDNYSFTSGVFSYSNLNFIGNAAQYQLDSSPSGGKNTVRLVGFTGNATYTYDNRYYIDLSYRVQMATSRSMTLQPALSPIPRPTPSATRKTSRGR